VLKLFKILMGDGMLGSNSRVSSALYKNGRQQYVDSMIRINVLKGGTAISCMCLKIQMGSSTVGKKETNQSTG
jgi:hypothetical protein